MKMLELYFKRQHGITTRMSVIPKAVSVFLQKIVQKTRQCPSEDGRLATYGSLMIFGSNEEGFKQPRAGKETQEWKQSVEPRSSTEIQAPEEMRMKAVTN